jgi:hypothetical protein
MVEKAIKPEIEKETREEGACVCVVGVCFVFTTISGTY